MGFDKAEWAKGAGNNQGKNVRLTMVGAAKNAGLKVGASKAFVHDLLGTPDLSIGRSDSWFLGQNDMAPDYVTLVVTYDAAGNVLQVTSQNS